ncbi:MAG: GDP-mannose 4,6-dehydratase, partial [Acidobacteriota bacterium]
MKSYLVTGGAGFIGSAFVLAARKLGDVRIINLDKLTYAGNLAHLSPLEDDPLHVFIKGDIADRPLVRRIMEEFRPEAVVNFAAESHVDRSIESPGEFIQTNVVGTFHLLEEARRHWESLPREERRSFR